MKMIHGWIYRMFATLTLIFLGATTDYLQAGPIKNLLVSEPYGSRVENLTSAGNLLFFTAEDPAYGIELWKSDGTANGTALVKDIGPGAKPAQTSSVFVGGHAYSSTPQSLVMVNGTLYFIAIHNSKQGLWRSDGAGANTQLVKDLSNQGNVTCMKAAGNRLFFRADTYPSTSNIWTSDGTADGTICLMSDFSGQGFHRLSSLGSNLYFMKSTNQLWRSDGTIAGTTQVQSFGGTVDSNDTPLQSAAGFLFLTVSGVTSQVWRTDGTTVGTIQLASTNSGVFVRDSLTAAGSHVFFFSRTSNFSTSIQLWRSNGEISGTTGEVWLNISFATVPKLYPQGDAVIFSHYRNDTGQELWRSDGTFQGTTLLKDLNPQYSSNPSHFTTAGAWVYFFANYTAGSRELWRTDGSAVGTILVKAALEIDTNSDFVAPVGDASGRLFFVANEPIHGRELWMSDGSEVGTRVLKDINGGSNAGAVSRSAVRMGSSIYFAYDDGEHGSELWKSDGTSGGTALVKDLVEGAGSSSPKGLRVFNGELLFFANSSLWKTDGTVGGTVHVFHVDGPSQYASTSMAEMNSALYFSGYQSQSGQELWKTDGTTAGTVMVKDIAVYSSSESSSPSDFALWSGNLYFRASSGYPSYDQELWKTDGTTSGTVMVKDIHTSDSSGPSGLKALPGGVCFFALDRSTGMRQLFFTDGTEAGTRVLKRIAYDYDEVLQDMRVFGSQVCFVVIRDGGEWELWKSDGTEVGTSMLRAFPDDDSPLSIHGSATSLPMAEAGGQLFFVGNDTGAGRELWKTNLTVAGTQRIKDVWPGVPNSTPINLTAGPNGKVFFSAADTTHGYELWQSDGTSSGTVMVEDLVPGMESAQPIPLTAAGDRLFYLAVAPGVTGWQLRTHSLPRQLVVSSSGAGGGVAGGGSFPDGTLAVISATPALGYVFSGWSGGGVVDSSSDLTTVAMTTDRQVMASFAAVPTMNGFASGFGLTGVDLGPLSNPAQDGVANLLKYAFNLSPAVPDVRKLQPETGTAGLPTIFMSDSGGNPVLHIEFLRRRGGLLTYTAQTSSALSSSSWNAINSNPIITPIDIYWERVVYQVPRGGLSGPSCFARVKVTLP